VAGVAVKYMGDWSCCDNRNRMREAADFNVLGSRILVEQRLRLREKESRLGFFFSFLFLSFVFYLGFVG